MGFRTSTIFTKKERRMIQFKKLGFGILLVVVACIGIPSAEAQNDLWSIDIVMQRERLWKACSQDGKGSRACKQYEEFAARESKQSKLRDQQIGIMDGHNRAGQMSNSINKSQQDLQYSKSASEYRQNADYWKQEYNRAMNSGDRRAAENARQQYLYHQQKAEQYKQ